jgi:hypothetical protein
VPQEAHAKPVLPAKPRATLVAPGRTEGGNRLTQLHEIRTRGRDNDARSVSRRYMREPPSRRWQPDPAPPSPRSGVSCGSCPDRRRLRVACRHTIVEHDRRLVERSAGVCALMADYPTLRLETVRGLAVTRREACVSCTAASAWPPTRRSRALGCSAATATHPQRRTCAPQRERPADVIAQATIPCRRGLVPR